MGTKIKSRILSDSFVGNLSQNVELNDVSTKPLSIDRAIGNYSAQYTRSLIEASLDPLVTISAEGKITDVNNASVRITGVPREELIGTNFSHYFTEPEKAQEGYHQVFEKGFVADYPLTIKHKNGKLTDVLYNASVYKDDKGNVLGVFAAARDITQSKNTEEQLRQVNKELEGFSYSVSHDLRAPLRAINGYAKILQEDYASKMDVDGIGALNAILNNSKKMGELIDDLLAFSRLGKKEVTIAEINMSSLVSSVRDEVMYGNSKEIGFKIDDLIPANGQQVLIKQIWVNLISNSIKFSEHNPNISIQIGSFYKDNLVVYYVKDNGIGFDMQYYDKLFGVFQRLHSQQEFEGTGIGLAIVQKIVTRHNGTVWAESKVNEGACFYFSLPIINS
jgi:PAS domain S-box-containing protein